MPYGPTPIFGLQLVPPSASSPPATDSVRPQRRSPTLHRDATPPPQRNPSASHPHTPPPAVAPTRDAPTRPPDTAPRTAPPHDGRTRTHTRTRRADGRGRPLRAGNGQTSTAAEDRGGRPSSPERGAAAGAGAEPRAADTGSASRAGSGAEGCAVVDILDVMRRNLAPSCATPSTAWTCEAGGLESKGGAWAGEGRWLCAATWIGVRRGGGYGSVQRGHDAERVHGRGRRRVRLGAARGGGQGVRAAHHHQFKKASPAAIFFRV